MVALLAQSVENIDLLPEGAESLWLLLVLLGPGGWAAKVGLDRRSARRNGGTDHDVLAEVRTLAADIKDTVHRIDTQVNVNCAEIKDLKRDLSHVAGRVKRLEDIAMFGAATRHSAAE